mgnify:CR=1 FL=1
MSRNDGVRSVRNNNLTHQCTNITSDIIHCLAETVEPQIDITVIGTEAEFITVIVAANCRDIVAAIVDSAKRIYIVELANVGGKFDSLLIGLLKVSFAARLVVCVIIASVCV